MKFEDIAVSETDHIKLPVPENYRDCLTLINSDLYRLTGKKSSVTKLLFHILTHPFSLPVWQRMCAYRGFLYYPFKVMHNLSRNLKQIDLPARTRIGYGLNLGHGRCIVINGGTIIGNNVNITQFTNIGTNHKTPAVIGDNVYIGPSVCLLEDVRIGSNSSIGAGAVVTKDVPADSTCAGVPAKVLNYNNPGRYIENPWKF